MDNKYLDNLTTELSILNSLVDKFLTDYQAQAGAVENALTELAQNSYYVGVSTSSTTVDTTLDGLQKQIDALRKNVTKTSTVLAKPMPKVVYDAYDPPPPFTVETPPPQESPSRVIWKEGDIIKCGQCFRELYIAQAPVKGSDPLTTLIYVLSPLQRELPPLTVDTELSRNNGVWIDCPLCKSTYSVRLA